MYGMKKIPIFSSVLVLNVHKHLVLSSETGDVKSVHILVKCQMFVMLKKPQKQ